MIKGPTLPSLSIIFQQTQNEPEMFMQMLWRIQLKAIRMETSTILQMQPSQTTPQSILAEHRELILKVLVDSILMATSFQKAFMGRTPSRRLLEKISYMPWEHPMDSALGIIPIHIVRL